MNIGIIVAMQKELDLLLPKLERMSDVNLDDADFYCGQLGDHELVVHQCGIGKVNAAMGALTQALTGGATYGATLDFNSDGAVNSKDFFAVKKIR